MRRFLGLALCASVCMGSEAMDSDKNDETNYRVAKKNSRDQGSPPSIFMVDTPNLDTPNNNSEPTRSQDRQTSDRGDQEVKRQKTETTVLDAFYGLSSGLAMLLINAPDGLTHGSKELQYYVDDILANTQAWAEQVKALQSLCSPSDPRLASAIEIAVWCLRNWEFFVKSTSATQNRDLPPPDAEPIKGALQIVVSKILQTTDKEGSPGIFELTGGAERREKLADKLASVAEELEEAAANIGSQSDEMEESSDTEPGF